MGFDPMTAMMIMNMIGTGAEHLFGEGNKGRQSSTYSKGAQSMLEGVLDQIKGMKGQADITQNQNYQTGQDWLQSMYNDPEFFNKFEAPMQRQFQEQTIPDLANRFASQGSGGSLGSTGFRNQLAREGSNLQTNIAALRGGMQQQGIPQLMGYAQQPAQNLMSLMGIGATPTMNQYQPPSAGLFGGMLPGMVSGWAQGQGQQWGQQQAGQNNPGQSPSTMGGYSGSGNYSGGNTSGKYGLPTYMGF